MNLISLPRPHVLLAGDGPLWQVALQALSGQTAVPLITASLPLSPDQLTTPGLRGVVYVCGGTGPCPDLVASLVTVYRRTGLPQVVYSEQLTGLFSRFPGVEAVSLHAPLEALRRPLVRVLSGTPPQLSGYLQARPALPLRLLQVLHWRRQGASMAEIAAQWQVPVRTAYARYHRYRLSAGLTNPVEYAAVYGMAGTLLQLLWPSDMMMNGVGQAEVAG